MNPVLFLLVVLGGFILWLLLSCLFFSVGKGLNEIYNTTKENILKEEKQEEEEK